jgi:hypothetical protein
MNSSPPLQDCNQNEISCGRQRLIDNVETGSNESTGQCIEECKRTLEL